MVIRAVVEALANGQKIKYEGADRLPGTDVVRT